MVATLTAPQFLESGQVARELGVSVEALRKWERMGSITPAQRTASGTRLYTPEHVEEIRRWREARRNAPDAPDEAA